MRTSNQELIFFEIEEMAREHRQILKGFAHLAAVPEAEFAVAYGRLLDQIEADFRAEESIMEKICYPDLRNHLRDHANLLGILHKARLYRRGGHVLRRHGQRDDAADAGSSHDHD
ncbi:hemerythrin domain-containing protein [Herbaspirillum sp. VT-16-41]|uniref:hemerythrin domain-containing protein n=1 Tax=Herbaspirillum sp. VT-16-41 TaxID=1953765 RepID=UPI0020C2C9BD|nr:hemerythrin domain-containing protein [Herbaspirillum sp. VT-16-41]